MGWIWGCSWGPLIPIGFENLYLQLLDGPLWTNYLLFEKSIFYTLLVKVCVFPGKFSFFLKVFLWELSNLLYVASESQSRGQRSLMLPFLFILVVMFCFSLGNLMCKVCIKKVSISSMWETGTFPLNNDFSGFDENFCLPFPDIMHKGFNLCISLRENDF